VALSDPEGILASPFTIINRKYDQADIKSILDIVIDRQVGNIIVGLPRSMDGSIGQQAEKVEGFTQKLREKTDVPVEFRDERLSTVTARRLIEESNPKKSKRKVHDDDIAAAIILQDYLDAMRHPFTNSLPDPN
jgi:putative Holliday junction resolvase